MPPSVVSGERMEFVDDEASHTTEEPAMIRLRRYEDCFQRLGRSQQAVWWIGYDASSVALAGVSVPAGGSPSHKLEVPAKAFLLVIKQGTDGADVQNRQPLQAFGEYQRDDRKERRLGLPSSGRCKNDDVRPIEYRLNRQTLHGSQFPPSERVYDVVLKGRMKSVEVCHVSSSMSSTLWA